MSPGEDHLLSISILSSWSTRRELNTRLSLIRRDWPTGPRVGQRPLYKRPAHRLHGQLVAEAAEPGDQAVGHRRHHRGVAEGLPGRRVREVELDHHPVEGAQRVVQRPRGVGQRTGVDHQGVEPAAGLVDGVDQATLVVGLHVLDAQPERLPGLHGRLHVLGQGGPAVDRSPAGGRPAG